MKKKVTSYFGLVLDVLHYFSFFNYPPTFDELYTFLKKKTSKRHFMSILERMEKESLIKTISNFKFQSSKKNSIKIDLTVNHQLLTISFDSLSRYTLPEYSMLKTQNYNIYNSYDLYNRYYHRYQISQQKIQKVLPYVRLLSLFPQIKLIGLSGSVAMFNANIDHDVDLFIITAKNRIWTGRFIALLLAQLFGVRRTREMAMNYELRTTDSFKDKVCLNLFFDESHLAVPKFKRTQYVAHEVLQMKPLIQKGDIYKRFIDTNKWVFDIFPNTSSKLKTQNSKPKLKTKSFKLYAIVLRFALCTLSFIEDNVEFLLKSLQLYFIRKHQTTEIITTTQLWFHPEDFGERMKKAI